MDIRRLLSAAFAGLALACFASVPASAQTLFSLTRQDAEAVAVALGWSPGATEARADGDFSQTFTLPSGMPVTLEGLACKSDNLDGCPEFELRTAFGVGSPEAADALASDISSRWANVWLPTGEAVAMGRMEFLYGGVTRAHVKETFATFGQLASDAAALAFPCGLPSHGVAPECPAESRRSKP